MTLETGARLALFARVAVSLVVVSSVSVALVIFGAAVMGTTALFAVGAVAAFLAVILTPFGGASIVIILESVSPVALLGVALVIGSVAFPIASLRPIRAEIRTFERELGTTGKPATDRHPKLASITRRLAQQAGVPEPTVRIVNRRRPESYALGSGSGGTIVLTRGVVRQLDDEELEAVLAHEVSHLANGDGRIVRLLLVPLLIGEDIAPDERPRFQFQHGFGPLTFLARLGVWAVVSITATVLLTLCHAGVALLSRGRETAADRGAATLTGSPAALASALERLDDARGTPSEDLRDFKRSAGVLDILPPADEHRLGRFFETHPDTETRIERLRSMTTVETA